MVAEYSGLDPEIETKYLEREPEAGAQDSVVGRVLAGGTVSIPG